MNEQRQPPALPRSPATAKPESKISAATTDASADTTPSTPYLQLLAVTVLGVVAVVALVLGENTISGVAVGAVAGLIMPKS